MKFSHMLKIAFLLILIGLLVDSCVPEPEEVTVGDLIYGVYTIKINAIHDDTFEVLALNESGKFSILDRCEGEFEIEFEDEYDSSKSIQEIRALLENENDGFVTYSSLGTIEITSEDCFFYDSFPDYGIGIHWVTAKITLLPEIWFDYLYVGSIEKNIPEIEIP